MATGLKVQGALKTTRAPKVVLGRLVDTAAEIMGDPDPDELAFLHIVLAQCGLPYRDPASQHYLRKNGRAALIVSAGWLLDPATRMPVLQGVPYGAKPRLLLIHLCTEAVRRQSACVPIADSMSAFMRELGLAVTGGATGSVGRFKEQLNRLAAARMQLTLELGDRGTTLNPGPVISRFDVWFPRDARQRVLWPSEVVLSAEFFASLQAGALPLDPRAVRALQHSARGLDIYTWLAHRLPRVRGVNTRVSWGALQGQFGPDIANPDNFRRKMLATLRQVLAVYTTARVDQVEGGLVLWRSAPPIHRKPG